MRTRTAATLSIAAALSLLAAACGGDIPPPTAPEPPPPAPPTAAPEATPPPPPTAAPVATAAPTAEPTAKPAEPAAKAPEAPAKAAAQPEAAALEGTLASRTGKTVVIEAAGSPTAGAKGALYVHFEQELPLLGKTQGWLGVADVTVKDVKGGKITLTVDQEKSKMTVNGKKVDHFKKGNRVKLELAK
jgi:outer membrane biosynthesis protein TonB